MGVEKWELKRKKDSEVKIILQIVIIITVWIAFKMMIAFATVTMAEHHVARNILH